MADVFISYSRKDGAFAKRLVNTLTKEGRDVWVDWEDIPRAADWLQEIYAGIESTDTFVLIVSQHSLISEICNYEIAHARKHNKRIIPVILQRIEGDVEVTVKGTWYDRDWQSIADSNWRDIKNLNWIFFDNESDFDTQYAVLIETIQTDLQHVKLHTRLLIRAREWEQNARSPSFLITGEELQSAEVWLASAIDKSPPATDLHRTFIEQSRRTEDEREARSRRLRTITRLAGAAVVVLVLVAIVAGMISVDAIGNSNVALTDVAQANQRVNEVENTIVPATLNAVATEVQAAENFAESVQMATRGEDTASNRQPAQGLALALEASYLSDAPQTQRILADLAYAPGARSVLEVNIESISSIAVSPDSQTIATSGGDLAGHNPTAVILWNMTTGEPIRHFENIETAMNSMMFSPDGQSLLTLSRRDAALNLWNVATGEPIRSIENNGITTTSMTFSPDGQSIVFGTADGQLIWWDIATAEPTRYFEGHAQPIHSIVFSPDRRMLATASGMTGPNQFDSGEIILFDVQTGDVERRFEGIEGVAYSMAFSPDGAYLLSGGGLMTVGGGPGGPTGTPELILWDVSTGFIERRFDGHNGLVYHTAFSSDGQHIISGSRDSLILWDTNSSANLFRFEGYISFEFVAFSAGAQKIISGAHNGNLVVWDVEAGHMIHQVEDADGIITQGSIVSVAFSPDGQTIAIVDSFGANSEIVLYDRNTGETIRRFEGDPGPFHTVIFSADGRSVFSGGRQLRWDVASGEIKQVYANEVFFYYYNLALSSSGKLMLSSDEDGMLMVWDTDTGEISHRLQGFTDSVSSVAFSPNGTVLSGMSSGELILWDMVNEQSIGHYEGHTASVNSVAFSPDGQTILSGSSDATLILRDADTGVMLQRLEGHTGAINSVAFSPDSRTAVSGAVDDTLILWDLTSGTILRRFVGHADAVNSVAFSPDGQTILSGSNDGTYILWRNDSLEQLQQWTRENRYLPQWSCSQRIIYGLPVCINETPPPSPTFAPTHTPFPLPIMQAS